MARSTRRAPAGRACRSRRRSPFDDVDALERAIDDSVAALIVEPVQGMSGARDCSHAFLRGGARPCARATARRSSSTKSSAASAAWARSRAAEFYGVTPDAITMAKGLASGFPIGAVTVGDFLSEGVTVGDLGSTFGGGPLACAAGARDARRDRTEDLARPRGPRVGRQLRERRARHWASRRCRVTACCSACAWAARHSRSSARSSSAASSPGTSSDPEILRLLPPLSFSHGRGRPAAGRARRGAGVIAGRRDRVGTDRRR